MNNKLVTNIILAYFIVISIVLVVQLCYKNKEEPVAENIPLSENLNDAVVLYNESPVMLVNTRQSIIDSTNSSIVPVIKNDNFYVPINFFKEAYNAVVSFNFEKNNATIRLNNTAWVLDQRTQTAQIIDSYSEDNVELLCPVLFENGTVYVSLNDFCNAFGKFVSFYKDNMAIIADKELSIEHDTELLAQLEVQVNNLPCVINSSNLKQLLGENSYGLPDINLNSLINNNKNEPDSISGIFKTTSYDNYAVYDNYLYIADNSRVKIIDTDLSLDEPVTDLLMDSNTLSEKVTVYDNRLIVMGKSKASEDFIESILIYDITEKSDPQLLKEFQTCGTISDYVIKNDSIIFITKIDAADLTQDKVYYPPYYYNDGEYTELSFENIRYMPEMQDKCYTSVFSIGLNDGQVHCYTILGVGDNLYLDNNGKNFYITAKRSINSFNGIDTEDTNLFAFSIGDDISYYKKTYLTGFMDARNLYNFNNHTFIVTEDNHKNIVYILDNNLECINKLDSIVLNTEKIDFIDERIYLQDKSNNVISIDINDINNCIQSNIVSLGNYTTLYHYKDSYFMSLSNDNVLSVLDMSDLEDIKTLSSITLNNSVNMDKLFVLKGGVSLEMTYTSDENSENATSTPEGNALENNDTEAFVSIMQEVYAINDNFNLAFVGNVALGNENDAVSVNNIVKINDKYIMISDKKISIYDEFLSQIYNFEK